MRAAPKSWSKYTTNTVRFEPSTLRSNARQIRPQDHGVLPRFVFSLVKCKLLAHRSLFTEIQWPPWASLFTQAQHSLTSGQLYLSSRVWSYGLCK